MKSTWVSALLVAAISTGVVCQSDITVVSGVSGTVLPRREIRDLASDADQWNIFLLGLARLQSLPANDSMSYYQLAGIHGAVWGAYSGVQACDGCEGIGYCTHHSTLFPVWHRPYLALFEQALWNNALAVAAEFPVADQGRYTIAAANLRLPYWDWAMDPPSGTQAFPAFMTTPQIQVHAPTGNTSIPNPLYAFTYPEGAAEPGYDRYRNKTTLRYPISSSESDNSQVVSAMATLQPQLQNSLYMLFTQQKNYDFMSTEMYMGEAGISGYNNLESIHDNIHVAVGGTWGNMWEIPVSGFDPTFWLHHAMVDRCFALWQALYPDQWLDAVAEQEGTFTIPNGATQNSSSPLTPFPSNEQGGFWTSDSSRNVSTFWYTYPELQNSANGSSVLAAITKLYSLPASSRSKRSVEGSALGGISQIPYQEYMLNILANSSSLQGSYQIFAFTSMPSDVSPLTFLSPTSGNETGVLLGYHAFFGSSSMPSMNSALAASVPITAGLAQAVDVGDLADLEKDTVAKYLAAEMQWQVVDMDGNILPPDQVPRISLQIVTSTVTPGTSIGEMPTWGAFEVIG